MSASLTLEISGPGLYAGKSIPKTIRSSPTKSKAKFSTRYQFMLPVVSRIMLGYSAAIEIDEEFPATDILKQAWTFSLNPKIGVLYGRLLRNFDHNDDAISILNLLTREAETEIPGKKSIGTTITGLEEYFTGILIQSSLWIKKQIYAHKVRDNSKDS